MSGWARQNKEQMTDRQCRRERMSTVAARIRRVVGKVLGPALSCDKCKLERETHMQPASQPASPSFPKARPQASLSLSLLSSSHASAKAPHGRPFPLSTLRLALSDRRKGGEIGGLDQGDSLARHMNLAKPGSEEKVIDFPASPINSSLVSRLLVRRA